MRVETLDAAAFLTVIRDRKRGGVRPDVRSIVNVGVGMLVGDLFDRSNVSAGTGVGLRFDTGVGPIRFDLAWKWCVRNTFESCYAWFLSFGNAF